MKKYLITGVSGFVGQHFIDCLEAVGERASVLGIDLAEKKVARSYAHVTQSFQKVDLLCGQDVERVLVEFQPDYVLHLAAFSSVAFSWKEPMLIFQNNMTVFLNLIEAIRRRGLKTRMLSVGSAEVYGNARQDALPLAEEAPLSPANPYAVARVSQEYLSKVYTQAYGMDLVITRSFNHIGPGQKEIFVISSFAKQITEIKKRGQSKGVLSTGDLQIIRDFLDVRDVARAYYLLLTRGEKGQIYNVCSGTGHVLQELLDELASIAGVEITATLNPELVRPSDNRRMIGSNKRICQDFGWTPQIPMRQSLIDILADWETRV